MVTYGTKRWAMISPECAAALAESETPPAGCDWSIGEWFSQEWPRIASEAQARGHVVCDFLQHAGELAFIPAGWWHAVINVESSIAVTHNVLPAATLQQVIAAASPQGMCSKIVPVVGNDAMHCSQNTAASSVDEAVVQAVVDAFDMVDVEGGGAIAAWLEELQRDRIVLLPDATVLADPERRDSEEEKSPVAAAAAANTQYCRLVSGHSQR